MQLLRCLVAFSRREQWRCLSFCSSSDAVNIQLCHRDRIHSASCAEVVVFHRAVLGSVDNAPVVLRQVHGFVSAETVEVPQLQYTDKVVVTSTRVGRSRDLAATSSRISWRQWEVPQTQSSTVLRRFLGAFCVIFRAPPIVPELSASFSSPPR